MSQRKYYSRRRKRKKRSNYNLDPSLVELILFRLIPQILKFVWNFLLKAIYPNNILFFRNLQKIIPESERRKHTYIIAGSWSGKSELIKILIHADLKKYKRRSIVLIEPHWDLSLEVANLKYFYKNKDRLVYIDPYLKKWYTPCINPLQIDDKTENNISRMTTALIDTFEGILWNTWSPRMETMLRYCIPVLLRRDDSTLQDLKRFMDFWKHTKHTNNTDLINLALKSPHQPQREYFENDFHDKSMETTKRGIRDRVSALLSSPVFSNVVLGASTIDLEKLINSGHVIIFNISKWKFGHGVTEAFWALLVSMLNFYAFKRVDIKNKKFRTPTNLILDEFHNFINKNTEKFESFLSETRKFNVFLTMANQYIKQIGPDLKQAIEENVGVQIQWRTKNDDELRKLNIWQFMVKSGNRDEVSLQVPKFLVGDSGAMSNKQWKEVVENQIEKYYRIIEEEGAEKEVLPDTENQEENFNFEKRETKSIKMFKPNL